MASSPEIIKDKSRRKISSGAKHASTTTISKIPHDEMLVVQVSRAKGAGIIAEFKISATDAVTLFLDKAVFTPSKSIDETPGEKLSASLIEAKTIVPRFAAIEELFNGLEKAAQG